MKITIWGCRGSMPSPGAEKTKYGGNTSCVQIESDKTCLILDGGSGIQKLGIDLDHNHSEINILLTHLHIDHIMGLGYFQPFYDPSRKVNIWGPASSNESLIKRLRRYFSPPFFPVRLNELAAQVEIHEIDNSVFRIGDFEIRSEYICHPGPTLGYRCELNGTAACYLPDHEPALGSSDFPNSGEWCSGYNLAREADILFHDSQYTDEEYKNRIGWGHCSFEDAIDFGTLAEVKKLVLFHHDPLNTDARLEKLFSQTTRNRNPGFEILLGRERDVFSL